MGCLSLLDRDRNRSLGSTLLEPPFLRVTKDVIQFFADNLRSANYLSKLG